MRIDNAYYDFSIAKNSYDKALKVNKKLNCLVTPIEPKENDNQGRLKNVPVILKDNVCTKGILTTASCKLLSNYVPVFNAHIVDKLIQEGAIIIGKSSMDELGMGGTNITAATGPVLNPYDLSRISGGSSGGSAVLVASNVTPLAIGTDTGDSIRKPAAFNGVIGMKPTYGRISRYGIIPYASSLDHVGYFTTNIKDACIGLEVLAGRDDRDMTSSFKEVGSYLHDLNPDVNGKKILVFKNVIDAISNEEIILMFNSLINELKNHGAIIKEISFNEKLLKAILPVYYIIANGEASANHSNLTGILFGDRKDGTSIEEIMMNTRSEGFGPWIKKRFVIGSYALFEENQERIFRKAQKIRRLIVEEILNELKQADILIAPAQSDIAPKLSNQSTNELSNEYLIANNHMIIGNFGGFPSISIPMGNVQGIPVGVNLTANLFDEQTLFDIGQVIENITGLSDLTKEDF